MTSQGIGESFAPGEAMMGYQVCEMSGSVYIGCNKDGKTKETYPEVLMNIAAGDEAYFRYVKSTEEWKEIEVLYSGQGKIQVWMNDQKVGSIDCVPSENTVSAKAPVKCAAGQYELKLCFEETEQMVIYQVTMR